MKHATTSRQHTRKPTARELKALTAQNAALNEPVYEKSGTVRLQPKNANQKKALAYLNSGTPVVLLTGSAGTGKSMLAAYRAATMLKEKKIDKVYLVRPAVAVGKSIGLLPGTIEEKLAPYFAQTVAHIEKFLGKGMTTYCLEKRVIEMKPVEYLRGMSFENCIVLVEESQNLTPEEFEMMLTRLGDNCQLIFTGDQKQNDLKGQSGLKTTIALLDKTLDEEPAYMDESDLDELDRGIGVVKFMPEDVVRSGLTKAFVKMYYHATK